MSLTPYASETSFSPTLLPLLSSLHQMPPSVNPHSLFFHSAFLIGIYTFSGDGSEFDTYLSEFKIRISRSGGTFKVNAVSIAFHDMYYTDWFVFHGIREVLSLPMVAQEVGDGEGDPFDEGEKRISGRMLVAADPDRSEF
ncbi:hypothetical protein Tco_0496439 [Tanacetum coccineum]